MLCGRPRRFAHAILHGALEQAVAWRLIERNRATGTALPRVSTPEMRPLTPAEARRFLAAARGHPLEALFVLAVTTGMHQGELLALRWRDLDWFARPIAVHHTLVRMNGRWWLGEPKTAKSHRSIDLTDPTIEPLRAHHGRQAERPQVMGHALTDDDLISATLQLTAGTNPKIVSEVLGDKEVAITLERYSHALPTLQAEAMGRLDAVLGRSPLDAPDEGSRQAPPPELWIDRPGSATAISAGSLGR